MLRYLYILGLLVFLTSCESDDTVKDSNQEVTHQINARINGVPFELRTNVEDYLVSGNTNCNNIYVTAHLFNGEQDYKLEVSLLKTGEIRQIAVWDRETENHIHDIYLSPLFQPEQSVTISDFDYDESSNDIRFSVHATLMEHGTSGTESTMDLEATIDIQSHLSTPCSVPFFQDLQYASENFEFHTISASITKRSDSPKRTHLYRSNDGYRLSLITADNAWSLPVGEYIFDQGDEVNTIILERYIGDLRASQSADYLPWEWETLETLGTIYIDRKQSGEIGEVHGRIDLQASSGEDILFNEIDIPFTTKDF